MSAGAAPNSAGLTVRIDATLGMAVKPAGLCEARVVRRVYGTTTTGLAAWCVTLLLTEPISSLAKAPLPRDRKSVV